MAAPPEVWPGETAKTDAIVRAIKTYAPGVRPRLLLPISPCDSRGVIYNLAQRVFASDRGNAPIFIAIIGYKNGFLGAPKPGRRRDGSG